MLQIDFIVLLVALKLLAQQCKVLENGNNSGHSEVKDIILKKNNKFLIFQLFCKEEKISLIEISLNINQPLITSF